MALVEVTPPASEPVSLAEAKLHLKIETADTEDDAIVSALIASAREYAEFRTRRQLVTATWKLVLDEFPSEIELPKPTLQSVSSVKYTDTDGTQQTLAASKYKVDAISEPARIEPAFGLSWPSTRDEFNAVVVRIVTGYGDAGSDVPEVVREAMKRLIAYWFQNRGDVVTGQVPSELAVKVDALLFTERVWSF